MKPLLLCLLLSSVAQAADIESDLVVNGGTPGGIAMAVRAAREGTKVLLVNHHTHLGGILSSGLGVWDTLWEGKRSPVYDEVRQAIFDHYRLTYGADSPQYRDALPGKSGHTNGKFEPRVVEKILTDMVAREKNITVLRGYVPVAMEREGALLRSVTFREVDGDRTVTSAAAVFADCSYEGDLLPLAKVPYRVGRESRSEFNEPHAGVIFVKPVQTAPTPEVARAAALHDRLNLRKFPTFEIILPASTGLGDTKVQAFNYRTVLTRDPANRVPVEQPRDYDVDALKQLESASVVQPLPNGKIGWNRPQLVGPHNDYVEGDRAARRRVMDAHWNATLGLLWYLQNDSAVPAATRAKWRELGLAKDEFTDNDHRPYELYVREARRLTGRTLFTQHDATLAPGLERAPVHTDSIAFAEWFMDAHAASRERVSGSIDEGKFGLHHETFPAQISWRTLLSQGVDNLLVPVCLSATHVAWGTIRLEPVMMQTGESAAFAVVQALKAKQTPAEIDADKLIRTLAQRHVMISFFNDVDVAGNEAWIPAAQYFGTKGFFADYDARTQEPVTEAVRSVWLDGFKQLQQGMLDATKLATAVHAAESKKSPPTGERRADVLLRLWKQLIRQPPHTPSPNPTP